MKISTFLAPTLRETPVEAEAKSHQLMLRAGYIRKLAAGIYTFLPLGLKVLENIKTIVREEMDNIGCQEMIMSAVLPAEPWQETGRWDVYGGEMFRLKDRKGRDFCLGPTHEEIVTLHVRDEVNSYKQLPMMLYQIQTKYRDEMRPRFGVIRSREFLMKDMYSFDRNNETMEESYKKAYGAYCRIFERCEVSYIPVEADTGAIGGSSSHEFVVQADLGECRYTHCKSCGYAANLEVARAGKRNNLPKDEEAELKLVDTPNAKTIEEVATFLNTTPSKCIKSMVYKADDRLVMVCVRGDDEICETKLGKAIGSKNVELASQEDTEKITKTVVGFAGPVGFDSTVIMDLELENSKGMVCGGLAKDKHYVGVSHGRDWKHSAFADIREVVHGDVCPKCGKEMYVATGLEVGHCFNLGTKYSKSMNATFLDENGKEQHFIMGCYGLGISRAIAAVIEQHSDEDGISWPITIAPYKAIVVPINLKDEEVVKAADEIYEGLKKEKILTLIDDRDVQAGVKFKDADLMGFPIRITVGKKVKEGQVEVRVRKTKEVTTVAISDAVKFAADYIRSNIK